MPRTSYVTETVTPAPVTQRVGKSDLSESEIALVLEGLDILANQRLNPAKAREAAALLSLAKSVTVKGITVTHV
jgi:ParB-like chromosome segregation protein Spo0J